MIHGRPSGPTARRVPARLKVIGAWAEPRTMLKVPVTPVTQTELSAPDATSDTWETPVEKKVARPTRFAAYAGVAVIVPAHSRAIAAASTVRGPCRRRPILLTITFLSFTFS